MTTNKPDMEPCPLCRKNDCCVRDKGMAGEEDWCRLYAVWCNDCGCSSGWYQTEAEAIAAWNTRHAQAGNALADELGALAKQALRESPTPWETDTEKNEGEYGAGPDTSTGFYVSLLLDAKGRSLFDALNSTATIVHEDYPDEYGDVSAWDETSRTNAALIVALVNNLPTILAALRQPVDAIDAEGVVEARAAFKAEMDALVRTAERSPYHNEGSRYSVAVMRDCAVRAFDHYADALRRSVEASGEPQKHRYWRPGEPDCPPEIKAGNGELHTLRCKVCGQDDPRDDRCIARAALASTDDGEEG